MSVFKPNLLSQLSNAKDRHFYIFHSKQDRVCPYRMASSANQQLSKNGAHVKFVEYSGGHGWRGDVFGNIRNGIHWLEKQNSKPSKKAE
jgi:predicted esterase